MPRPKVCHIIHEDGPGGGPNLVIDHLIAFAGEMELSVIHGAKGRIARQSEVLGIPHWQLPLDRLPKLPLGLPALISRLKKLRSDLVILHGQWAGPVGAIASRIAGIRRGIYISQWPSFYSDWDIGRLIRNRLAETVPCTFATRIVTPSRGNYYQYLLRRLATPEKLRVIHNSIDPAKAPLPEASANFRRQLGWSDDKCHVVSVGRLADQKCLTWLLQSWKEVSRKAPEARLWIVGDGPEDAALRKFATALELSESVTFCGPNPNGIQYIAAADFVVMTSLYEGHANVPLEAMACGRAIVASEVDGISDSFRDGMEGFLVPAADTDLFAEKVLLLIADRELRERMGRQGRNRVQAFSPAGMIGEYRALIDEVLASP